jgi:hypothetical protein
LQRVRNGVCYTLAKELISSGVKVNVVWVLHALQVRSDRGEEIIYGDLVFLHDRRRSFVSLDLSWWSGQQSGQNE